MLRMRTAHCINVLGTFSTGTISSVQAGTDLDMGMGAAGDGGGSANSTYL